MNKWKQLQTLLDKTFGFDHTKQSFVKRIKQYFDENSDEHVFPIEYRVRRDMNLKQTQHEKNKIGRGRNITLLRDINSRVENQ